MLKWRLLLCSCLLSVLSFGQPLKPASNLIAIDHVPVVVKDINAIQQILRQVLHFTIKPGREHEGIKNCCIKFEDGSYLEFTQPVDSNPPIGKYYSRFSQTRQGGTKLVVSVRQAASIISYLNKNHIPFDSGRNPVWITVSPKKAGLFFIEYRNKQWKDSKENTTHANGALSLRSVYLLSTQVNSDAALYQSFGFKAAGTGTFQLVPFRKMTVGESNLFILDAAKAGDLKASFQADNMQGICGYEISVRSLTHINSQLAGSTNARIEDKKIFYFFKEYNFFIVFTSGND